MSTSSDPPTADADQVVDADLVSGADTRLLEILGDGRLVESDGDAGRAVLEYMCKDEMCHSGGVAQGGFVTAWLDSAIAYACIARYTTAFWIATLEIKVSFFRPVPPGRVVAEGWMERAGKQTVFAEGRLLDSDGEVLAKASSTIRLVPNRHPDGTG